MQYIVAVMVFLALGLSGCFWLGLGTGAVAGGVAVHEYDKHQCAQGNWSVNCPK